MEPVRASIEWWLSLSRAREVLEGIVQDILCPYNTTRIGKQRQKISAPIVQTRPHIGPDNNILPYLSSSWDDLVGLLLLYNRDEISFPLIGQRHLPNFSCLYGRNKWKPLKGPFFSPNNWLSTHTKTLLPSLPLPFIIHERGGHQSYLCSTR